MPTPAKTEAEALLKQKFKITPKSASLLTRLGYIDYRDLKSVSPEIILHQFEKKLGLTHRLAEGYRAALRRLVWLGTQEKPEDYPKDCKNWTQKALKAKGVWSPDFDSLTGEEIAARLKGVE